jgi:hypothetical protein
MFVNFTLEKPMSDRFTGTISGEGESPQSRALDVVAINRENLHA